MHRRCLVLLLQDHRDVFATVMSSTMTNFAKVVASAVHPSRPFQQNVRAGVMDVKLAVTSSSCINNSNSSFSRTSPGDAVPFSGVLADRDVDEVCSGRVDHACSDYLHSGFLTFF